MLHIQTQAEWEHGMSVKILEFIRNELYLDLRFLNLALSALIPKEDASLQSFATDGIFIRYSSGHLIHLFKNNPRFLTRAYLHSILHCIYSHLWLAGNRNKSLWDTACDIAVEYTADNIGKPCTERILSWLRKQTYDSLKQNCQGISAATIYQMLACMEESQVALLRAEFYTDDHSYWPYSANKSAIHEDSKKHWDKIARQSRIQQVRQGEESGEGERIFEAQIKAAKSRRSYRDFLKKFSLLREELHCSPDEFDLNFYTYGFRIYGNMPLIEPLETREIKKIQEFVIVIDTSGSTEGSLVKNFLRETFQILSQREYFFSKCKIRILQCDDEVRMDEEIIDLSQTERFLGQFTICGGGGTNFCPAFAYVDKLYKQGIFKNLKGLLYFTDGEGIYPKKRPKYETAFLFLKDYDKSKVPPWAMQLRLEPEEFYIEQVNHRR